MVKVRRSIWIDDRALLLLQGKGINLSTLISKTMLIFLDLPEDPREKIIQDKIKDIAIRLRIQYEEELRARIREFDKQNEVQDLDRAAADQRNGEILNFGDMLQKTTCWPRVQTALQDLDAEAPCWEMATREIQVASGNGKDWDIISVWNMAIDWWKRYGRNSGGTKVQGKI